MPRPRDPNKKVQLSIRIEPELLEGVRQMAGDDEKSVSHMIGRAVEHWLRYCKRKESA